VNKETARESFIVETAGARTFVRESVRRIGSEVISHVLYLLFATFVTALAVSFFVMRLFTKPVDSVLHRIIADRSAQLGRST